jgi:hypothetical protein
MSFGVVVVVVVFVGVVFLLLVPCCYCCSPPVGGSFASSRLRGKGLQPVSTNVRPASRCRMVAAVPEEEKVPLVARRDRRPREAESIGEIRKCAPRACAVCVCFWKRGRSRNSTVVLAPHVGGQVGVPMLCEGTTISVATREYTLPDDGNRVHRVRVCGSGAKDGVSVMRMLAILLDVAL